MHSCGIVTLLKPHLGYKVCSEMAHEAYHTGKSLHQIVVVERKLLTQEEWEKTFNLDNLIVRNSNNNCSESVRREIRQGMARMKTYQSSARMFVKIHSIRPLLRGAQGKGVSLIRERIMDIITVLQIVVLLGQSFGCPYGRDWYWLCRWHWGIDSGALSGYEAR